MHFSAGDKKHLSGSGSSFLRGCCWSGAGVLNKTVLTRQIKTAQNGVFLI
jgi:hypothetical protein